MPLNPKQRSSKAANSRRRIAIPLAILLLLTAAVAGASFISARPPEEVVTLRNVWSADGAHPGDGALLAVVLEIATSTRPSAKIHDSAAGSCTARLPAP